MSVSHVARNAPEAYYAPRDVLRTSVLENATRFDASCHTAILTMFALVLGGASGCKSGSHASGGSGTASGSGAVVEPVFRSGQQTDRDGIPELALAIDRVYTDQQPATAPPFHAAGGDWTYLDVHVASDPAAAFAIGVSAGRGVGDSPSFGDAMLVPTTHEAGERVVAAFSHAFAVPDPAPEPGKLAPVGLKTAILGVRVADQQSAYGGSGTWTATKWFLSSDDIDSAEVFFNFSAADKHAVLSQKDEDYDKDVARVLAIALRDGKPLPRTPATDPTLAAAPAQLVLGNQLPGKRVEVVGGTPEHALLEIEADDHATLTHLDLSTGATKQLYRTSHVLDVGACARVAARCVVRETKPASRDEHHADDPSSLLLVEDTTVTPLAIATTAYGMLAISDDGNVLVIDSIDANRNQRLVAWDVASKRQLSMLSSAAASPHGPSFVEAWRGHQAIVEREPRAENTQPTYVLWDVQTGKQTPIDLPEETRGLVSPDGSRRVDFAAGKVTVTPLPHGAPRALALYPRDYEALADGELQWLDGHSIAIPGRRYWGVLDTDAMKVSLVPDPPALEDPPRIDVLRGTSHVIVHKDEGVFLGLLKP